MAGEGIEEAAGAFQTDMGGGAPPRESAKGAPEQLFGGSDEIENADEPAGGDQLPVRGAKPERRDPESGRFVASADDEESSEEDEASSEEEDAEAGDEEAGDEEEAGDDKDVLDFSEEELSKKVRVKIDGEETTVPLKEALKSGIREETFHRRLNAIHEASDQLAAQAAEVQKNRETYLERLDALTKELDRIVPAEPNWAELEAKDPAEALRQMKRWREYGEQRQALDAEKAKVQRESSQEQQRLLQQYIASENKKALDKYPKWHDPKERARDIDSMKRTAKAEGFSDEEVAQVFDHRMLGILRKASKYDRMMAAKPKPKESTKPGRPGGGPGRTAPKARNQALGRLAKTGSVEDAASAFQSILGLK